MENERLLKARANAGAGVEKCYVAGGRNDERFLGGGGGALSSLVSEARYTRVILDFYPGSHARSNAKGTVRSR